MTVAAQDIQHCQIAAITLVATYWGGIGWHGIRAVAWGGNAFVSHAIQIHCCPHHPNVLPPHAALMPCHPMLPQCVATRVIV